MTQSPFFVALLIVFATTCLTVTTTKAKIFAPARSWIAQKSKFFGELVGCPYCTCHWYVIIMGVIYRPRLLVSSSLLLDLVVSVLAMIGASAVLIGLVIWLFSSKRYTFVAKSATSAKSIRN